MDSSNRQEAVAIILSEDFIQRMNFSSESRQSTTHQVLATTNNKQETDKSSNSLPNLHESCSLSLKSMFNNTKKWTIKEEICYYLSTANGRQVFTNYWTNNKYRLPLLSSVVCLFNDINTLPCQTKYFQQVRLCKEKKQIIVGIRAIEIFYDP